ncbi:MAG: hypothetical protein ACR2I0_03355 [Rhodoferax sp.]
MEQDGADLYVEPSMPPDQRQALRAEIARGRAQVAQFFGEIRTDPYIVACASTACATRFGSYGERAAAFGDIAIRLSPNGWTAGVVAHEWVHAEVYRRVGGFWRINAIPRWFDEGVAVVVANEPIHSELNWQEIQRRRLPTPTLGTLRTRADWVNALRQYGETKVDDPDNLRVVYSMSGHTLRSWMRCAGPNGVAPLLEAVRGGEDFEAAFARLGGGCVAAMGYR